MLFLHKSVPRIITHCKVVERGNYFSCEVAVDAMQHVTIQDSFHDYICFSSLTSHSLRGGNYVAFVVWIWRRGILSHFAHYTELCTDANFSRYLNAKSTFHLQRDFILPFYFSFNNKFHKKFSSLVSPIVWCLLSWNGVTILNCTC